jgi:hypothetical protein
MVTVVKDPPPALHSWCVVPSITTCTAYRESMPVRARYSVSWSASQGMRADTTPSKDRRMEPEFAAAREFEVSRG